jgi:pimeloyl-ACP methyl ester carboxylesterase
MRRVIAVAATGFFLLTGCATEDATPSGTATAAAPATLSSSGSCPGMLTAIGGEEIRFGANGATNLGGVLGGTGTTGIVLAHQNGGSVCEWKDVAPELVDKGYRVLAFDFQGFGVSQAGNGTTPTDDVTAAVSTLRARGATEVVLVGASMGGTYSLAAAAAVGPPVAAVISASGPAVFNGISAEAAVPKLTMPVLFVAAEYDGDAIAAVKALHPAAKKSPDAQLKVVSGSLHGYELLAPAGDKDVRETFQAFLAKNAPAS